MILRLKNCNVILISLKREIEGFGRAAIQNGGD